MVVTGYKSGNVFNKLTNLERLSDQEIQWKLNGVLVPSCTKESQRIKTHGKRRRQAFFKVCEYCRYIISDNEHLKVLKATHIYWIFKNGYE